MIIKIFNNEINDLYELYKKDYKPLITEFTKIYSYFINNNYVGFIVFDIIYDRCEIIDIFVLEEYRKQGIASKLITEIINDYEIVNITLEVNKENFNAIKLYEKLGFKCVSIRKDYYNGIDGLLMLKEVR